MCIYMGVRKSGPFPFQNSGHSYTFIFKKGGLIIYLGALKGGIFGTHIYTMSYIGYHPPPPPPRLNTIYGAGAGEKKIDLYDIYVHNPEGCCFMLFTDLDRSV